MEDGTVKTATAPVNPERGKAIAVRMDEMGITPADVAVAANVNVQMVYYWRQGRKIRDSHAAILAEMLGIDVTGDFTHGLRDEPLTPEQHERIASVIPFVYREAGKVSKASGVSLDDVLSEAFVMVIRAAQTYREDADTKFITWVGQCMRGVWHRVTRNDRKCPLRNAVSIHADDESDRMSIEPSHEDTADAGHAVTDMLVKVRSKCDPVDYAILYMYYAQGMSGKEIGAKVGVTRQMVNTRLTESVNRLRRAFGHAT